MPKILYLSVFGAIVLATLCSVFVLKHEYPSSKLDEALQITPLKNLPLPISDVADIDEKRVDMLDVAKEPALEEVPEDLSFKPSNPYEELRSRGAPHVSSNSASYIDNTIKLEKNMDQELEDDNVVQAEVNNPYTELKELNQEIPPANTLKYIESTTSLTPDS